MSKKLEIQIEDILKQAGPLDVCELGMFIKLAEYYKANKDLPSDDLGRARVAQVSLSQFKMCWERVQSLFPLKRGRITCPIIDNQIAKAEAFSKMQREKALKMHQKRRKAKK